MKRDVVYYTGERPLVIVSKWSPDPDGGPGIPETTYMLVKGQGVDLSILGLTRTPPKVPRPRVTFCWYCGKKLRAKKGGGYHYAEVELEGQMRIIHVSCEEYYWEECRR